MTDALSTLVSEATQLIGESLDAHTQLYPARIAELATEIDDILGDDPAFLSMPADVAYATVGYLDAIRLYETIES